MEISKELLETESDKDYLRSFILNMRLQKNDLEKKLHIFKVIELANTLKEMNNAKIFQEDKIVAINIWRNFDTSLQMNTLNFELRNFCAAGMVRFSSTGNYIHPGSKFNNAYEEQLQQLHQLFKEFDGFNSKYVDESYCGVNNNETIEFSSYSTKKITDFLLSSELKSILYYNRLKSIMPNDKEEAKRTKV